MSLHSFDTVLFEKGGGGGGGGEGWGLPLSLPWPALSFIDANGSKTPLIHAPWMTAPAPVPRGSWAALRESRGSNCLDASLGTRRFSRAPTGIESALSITR